MLARMNFRPRYSLLTLLILTAIVAGGVKLWRGPHHVVEERVPGMQLEYTYTRGWRGEKIVHGPSIIRICEPNGRTVFIGVISFRNDQELPGCYTLLKISNHAAELDPAAKFDLNLISKLHLSETEQGEFLQAVEFERKRTKQNPGNGFVWQERLDDFRERPGYEAKTFRYWEENYKFFLNRPADDFILQ